MAPKNKLFLGLFIHSISLKELEYLQNTAVCVNAEGTIVAVEKDCNETKAKQSVFPRLGWADAEVEVVQAKEGQFFFPGFIDTHIHAPQYPNAGIFGDSTLLDWLNTYTFPLEASFSDLAKASRIYKRVIHKTLSHGTTCAAYYATIHVPATNLLADLCFARGQRALIGRVCMDQTPPDDYRDESAEASVAATRASIAHIRSLDPTHSLIRPVITPRFALSCSFPLLQQLGQLAAETGLPIQTHISENPAEIALVKKRFPRSLTGAADDSYAGVYDAAGLLTARTVLAHAAHLTEAEAALAARRGAGISHCPCSNTALGSGAARVRRLLDRGLACGLGTDVSGGYSPSVLEAARQAVLVSRHVVFMAEAAAGGEEEDSEGKKAERERQKLGVEEVLYLATRGGAQVVGLAGRVGGFAVGMEWDAQLVGLGVVGEDGELVGGEEPGDGGGGGGGGGNVDVFGWESWPNRVAKWVYNGDDRNTKKVWVRGRLVHERK